MEKKSCLFQYHEVGPCFLRIWWGLLPVFPEFELSVFNQLQSLKAEVDWVNSTEPCDDDDDDLDLDLSVDELKIFKDEDLVNKVFEETFQEEEIIGERDASISDLSVPHKPDRKKRRREKILKNRPLKGKYMTKVEKFAKIKQKQEEDKAAARLHSFTGSGSGSSSGTKVDQATDRLRSTRSSSTSKVKVSDSVHMPIHFPEVVLCVEVYHGKKTWPKTIEYWVLGQQFLTELRNKICCLVDDTMEKVGRYDPSGYFLSGDVFYNDLRQPSATNYSQPILEWLENSRDDVLQKWECIANGNLENKQKEVLGNQAELRVPRFKSFDMQKTRFCDLKFRPGAGYLYCHQGDCKHAIVIRDMRLIQPEDIQNRATYPLLTHQTKTRVHKCSVCKVFRATKVKVDDKGQ